MELHLAKTISKNSKHTFTMKAFAESVDKFLSFNEYEVLTNKGIYQNYKLIRKLLLSIKNLIVRKK